MEGIEEGRRPGAVKSYNSHFSFLRTGATGNGFLEIAALVHKLAGWWENLEEGRRQNYQERNVWEIHGPTSSPVNAHPLPDKPKQENASGPMEAHFPFYHFDLISFSISLCPARLTFPVFIAGKQKHTKRIIV